jgi:hypothetical protein
MERRNGKKRKGMEMKGRRMVLLTVLDYREDGEKKKRIWWGLSSYLFT